MKKENIGQLRTDPFPSFSVDCLEFCMFAHPVFGQFCIEAILYNATVKNHFLTSAYCCARLRLKKTKLACPALDV